MRFLYHVFPMNQPAAQEVWDYCQRQFISGLSGKQLDVASDGALVLKHFDADPFGLQASVLGQAIPRPAATPAPAPSPAPKPRPIGISSGDKLAGGLVAVEQDRFAAYARFRAAKNKRRKASRKRRFEEAQALADGAGEQAGAKSE